MVSTNQTTNQLPSMTQQQQQQIYPQMRNNLEQFSPQHFANNNNGGGKGSSSQVGNLRVKEKYLLSRKYFHSQAQ